MIYLLQVNPTVLFKLHDCNAFYFSMQDFGERRLLYYITLKGKWYSIRKTFRNFSNRWRFTRQILNGIGNRWHMNPNNISTAWVAGLTNRTVQSAWLQCFYLRVQGFGKWRLLVVSFPKCMLRTCFAGFAVCRRRPWCSYQHSLY